jgi:hypothetical protein
MADFDLSYIIKAVDDFTPVFDKLKQSLKEQEKTVLTFQQKMKSLSTNLKTMGTNLRNYVTLPIMAAAGYSFKTFANFRDMQLRLKAVTTSTQEYAKAWNNVKSLSMKTPCSQEDITGATLQLRSA